MKSGDHALAASEYGIAYEHTRDASLLLKIATAHDKAGNCEAARTFYGRYVHEGNPDGELKALAEERMQACEAALQAQGAGTEASTHTTGAMSRTTDPASGSSAQPERRATAPTGESAGAEAATDPEAIPGFISQDQDRPPSFADEPVSWQRNAAWLSVGVTVSLATAGAVLALSASSREEDIQNLIDFRYPDGQPAAYEGNTRARYEELIDEGKSLATYSKIAFGAAGVAAATAAAFFVLDARATAESRTSASARLAPMATPRGLGMTAAWSF